MVFALAFLLTHVCVHTMQCRQQYVHITHPSLSPSLPLSLSPSLPLSLSPSLSLSLPPPSGVLTLLKFPYPREVEEPECYDNIRVHAEWGQPQRARDSASKPIFSVRLGPQYVVAYTERGGEGRGGEGREAM